jgi:RND family efflux transporter MFP subunit
MRSATIRFTPMLVLGLASLLLAARVGLPDRARAADVHPTAVQVSAAVERSWPQFVRLPGAVSAVELATLASREGGRVSRVAVRAGSVVKAGDLIAEVGLTNAQAQLDQAQANLASQQAILDEAAASNKRYTQLYSTKAASQQQYQSVHRSYLTAKAAVSVARSALSNAQNNLTYARIKAPFAGTVAKKYIDVGDFVGGGAPLVVIAGRTPKIEAQVGPDVYAALKPGDHARVSVDGKTWPAVITLTDASADPGTHTHLIEMRLTTAKAQLPYGAYAEVSLATGRTKVLAVPAAALVRRAGLLGVFVVGPQGHANFRLVRTGARQGDEVAVVAGLSAGEKVIVAPPPGLMNGSAVTASASAAQAADKTKGADRG